MGNSYFEVVSKWLQNVLYDSNTRVPRNPRMPVSGDSIFSYGSHFEMARLLRDRKGNSVAFLINGETYSNTTSGHQSCVRSGIAQTRMPSVIIPFAALNAAGIDADTLRIVHRTQDTTEVKEYVHYELPRNAILEWVDFTGYRELWPRELEIKLAEKTAERQDQWDRYHEYSKDGSSTWAQYADPSTRPGPITLEQLMSEHRYGTPPNQTWTVLGQRLVCWVDGFRKREWDVTYMPDGTTEYRREVTKHWLGESLIEARVGYTVTRTCKWCKGSGRAEGPSRAIWKPPAPRLEWVRMPGNCHTELIDILQDAPGFFEEMRWTIPSCPSCDGRGRWSVWQHRTARFLSAFDRNETRPSYFFCEMPPKCTAETIDEALTALKPDAVRLAEGMGREVKRQGDIFAIPLPTTTKRSLRAAGATFEKRGALFNTNHVATETAYLPDGTTVIRGCLYHAPQWRRPDHKRVTLGGTWHVVQKNLVPIAA